MAELSERLIHLRNERNILQKDIATAINMSIIGYQRYEYGTRKPTSDIIIALCRFYNVTSDYLLGLSETKERQP